MTTIKPATPLPYHVEDHTDIYTIDGFFVATTHEPGSMVGTRIEYEHAAYIVHAANSLPLLEAELARVAGERAELVAALRGIDSAYVEHAKRFPLDVPAKEILAARALLAKLGESA